MKQARLMESPMIPNPVKRKVEDPTLELYNLTYIKMDIERCRKSMFARPPVSDSKTVHVTQQRYSDMGPKICVPVLDLYWADFPEELWPQHVKNKSNRAKAIKKESKVKEMKFKNWLPILEEKVKTEMKTEHAILKKENFDSKSWDTKVDLLENVYKQFKKDETDNDYHERIDEFEKEREVITQIVRLKRETSFSSDKEEEDDDKSVKNEDESEYSDEGDYAVDHYNDSDDAYGNDGDDDMD